MLHNSLVYFRKNSVEGFHNLYRIIVLKMYEMVCNSYMIEHKNKNVSIIIRSKKLPETISLIDKSQDSREAKLLTQHFCKSSRSKCGAHKKQLFVLWQSNKTVKREGEKLAFKKPQSPCRFKVHTYGFRVLGGVGGVCGVLDHGYLYLTFLLVNSNSSIRCCNTGRPSTIFR